MKKRSYEAVRATKVWEAGEPEPEGLFDPKACPNAPPNWFREEPVYAAELFAMELCLAKRPLPTVITVRVLDTEGTRHEFKVELRHSLETVILSGTHMP